MESQTAQRTIFGEEINELVNIETTGRTIRPFKRMIDQVADEYRIAFNEDGIHVDVVDTANVQLISATLHADALDAYHIEEDTQLGINSTMLGSALQHARYGKSTDDPISITADAEHLQTETTRELGTTEATLNERVKLTDPDAIRESPNFPDFEYEVTVDVEPRAFSEVAGILDKDNTVVSLGSNPESIVFKQDGDLEQRNIRLNADPDGVTEWTHFTVDYFKAWMKALEVGYVDNLTLKWSEEFPLVGEFEREGVVSGEIMVAPRIQSE